MIKQKELFENWKTWQNDLTAVKSELKDTELGLSDYHKELALLQQKHNYHEKAKQLSELNGKRQEIHERMRLTAAVSIIDLICQKGISSPKEQFPPKSERDLLKTWGIEINLYHSDFDLHDLNRVIQEFMDASDDFTGMELVPFDIFDKHQSRYLFHIDWERNQMITQNVEVYFTNQVLNDLPGITKLLIN